MDKKLILAYIGVIISSATIIAAIYLTVIHNLKINGVL